MKVLKLMIKLFGIFIFCFGLYNFTLETKSYSIKKYTEVRNKIKNKFTIVEYKQINNEPIEEDLETIINVTSLKYGINPIITKAIIKQESDFQSDALRYEEKWKLQYQNSIKRKSGESEESWKMNFKSIGLMQIGYGIHKDFCNLNSYTELFDPKKNIECGLKIFKECLDDQDLSEEGAEIKYCLKRYNGSGNAAENYSVEVMSRIAMNILNNKKMS